jgi:ABC-type antimicrobial peptide transport system permease subunit
MNLVLGTRGDAPDIGVELRTSIAAVDPGQPLPAIRTMNTVVSATAAQPRFYGFLLGLFAAVAAVLAAVGLYGVIAYTVGRRTREIGIRMALGATSANVLGLIAAEGMRPIVVGLAAGLAGAYFASRLLASRLYQVTAHDAEVFTLVPFALVVIATAACWAPMRRAMRVDPAACLRQD